MLHKLQRKWSVNVTKPKAASFVQLPLKPEW